MLHSEFVSSGNLRPLWPGRRPWRTAQECESRGWPAKRSPAMRASCRRRGGSRWLRPCHHSSSPDALAFGNVCFSWVKVQGLMASVFCCCYISRADFLNMCKFKVEQSFREQKSRGTRWQVRCQQGSPGSRTLVQRPGYSEGEVQGARSPGEKPAAGRCSALGEGHEALLGASRLVAAC